MRLPLLLAVLTLLGVASALLDSLQLGLSQLEFSQQGPSQVDSSQVDSSQVDSNNAVLPANAEDHPVETLLSILTALYEHASPGQQAELEHLHKFISSLRNSLQAITQTIDKII